MKKTVLLLGGYGFIGTNILDYIGIHLSDAYRVIVFDKFPAHPAGLRFRCAERTYAGDFSDSYLLESIFTENSIDMVIHALSTTVPAVSFNAKYDVESNLVPTIGLLDTMARHGVRDIVYISSGGAVYGDSRTDAHAETDDVFPKSSYGVVKLAIEKYLMQYAGLYGFRPLILRLSNPYGPFHYSMKQGICNVAMATALRKDTFRVWGDGNGCKDYIYISDFVDILFRLIDLKVNRLVVNIGSGSTCSVNGILGEIKKLVPGFKWEYTEASKFDVSDFRLDLSLLEKLIGKYRFVSLEEGLKLTYRWTKTIIC